MGRILIAALVGGLVMFLDEAASKAWAEKSKASPYAYVVYDPVGQDPSAMGENLGKQFGSDVLAALVLALVLSVTTVTLGARALIGARCGNWTARR